MGPVVTVGEWRAPGAMGIRLGVATMGSKDAQNWGHSSAPKPEGDSHQEKQEAGGKVRKMVVMRVGNGHQMGPG